MNSTGKEVELIRNFVRVGASNPRLRKPLSFPRDQRIKDFGSCSLFFDVVVVVVVVVFVVVSQISGNENVLNIHAASHRCVVEKERLGEKDKER